MIEDVFKLLSHNDDMDNPILQMHCKKCEHEFEVHLNILTPKNCKHELGVSITFFCPNCNVEERTTAQVYAKGKLQQQIDILRTKVESYLASRSPKFKPQGLLDYGTCSVPLLCLTCGFKFIIGMMNSINCALIDDVLTTRCPKCGTADIMTRAQAAERIEIFVDLLKLKELEAKKTSMGGSD